MRTIVITTAAALFISPATAFAQASQQPQQQQPAAKTQDPDQIICEKQEVVGSRIATQRICMTRSQWADQRRSERMDLERAQTQRGCTKNGC